MDRCEFFNWLIDWVWIVCGFYVEDSANLNRMIEILYNIQKWIGFIHIVIFRYEFIWIQIYK